MIFSVAVVLAFSGLVRIGQLPLCTSASNSKVHECNGCVSNGLKGLFNWLARDNSVDYKPKLIEDINQIEWWKKTNFYHIYIRSFMDSDGDGEGDLRGVVQKLDYLSKIGVETLLLSPFYSSPMKDIGYDIDDYVKVSEHFGTMRDFEDLVSGLKARGMKLVVDFVPNHTSNKHYWFECSERALLEPDRCGKYRDYYIWNNSTRYEGKFPTNWISLFGVQSAWTWSDVRQEFYLHQFLVEQPDLNLNNPMLREELKEVIRFWLRKGADGIRIDALPHLFEDTVNWPDDPLDPNYDPASGLRPYYRYLHPHTRSRPESAEIVKEWLQVCNEPEFGGNRVVITEAYDTIPITVYYYGSSSDNRFADMPFNFELVKMKDYMWDPQNVTRIIQSWIDSVRNLNWPDENGAQSPWSCWVSGNHDKVRPMDRLGRHNFETYRFITYMVPGVPANYYGDELGMHESDFNAIPQRTIDEGEPTRLAHRAPIAWTPDEPSGGFSSNASTWLPLNSNFKLNNVQSLLEEKGKNSLSNFIQLQNIRRENLELFTFGDFVFFKDFLHDTSHILAMARTHAKFGNILMVANFDNLQAHRLNLAGNVSLVRRVYKKAPKRGTVVMVSHKSPGSSIDEGQQVDLTRLVLGPSQVALIKF